MKLFRVLETITTCKEYEVRAKNEQAAEVMVQAVLNETSKEFIREKEIDLNYEVEEVK